MNEPRILVTGVAGFIGNHVAHRLIAEGRAVSGLDNVNAYYDTALKEARLRRPSWPSYAFHRPDLTDLARDVGFAPSTPLETGIGRFVDWYRDYHRA